MLTWYCILHLCIVIPFIVFNGGMSLKRPKKDCDKKVMNVTQWRTWRMCCLVFTLRWCACAILICDSVHMSVCMCRFSHVNIHVIRRWPVCLCMCTFTLPHVYMKARVYECDSVCEPVGSLPVVCSWRYAYGETEASSGAPLPQLWWKAALIEWPGTQPPFLIITAVQSLLITLKVCRAPHSPVMLQAIRESERKIRRFWQNPLSKKLKRVEKGADVKAV